MRKLLLGVVGATALAIASAAQAVTPPLIITPGAPGPNPGTGDPNPPTASFIVVPDPDGSIGATIGHVGIVAGDFVDAFQFTIGAAGIGSGSITTSVNLGDYLGKSDLDIDSVVISNSNGTWNAIQTLRDLAGLPCLVEGVGTCGAGETFQRNDVLISAGDLNTITVTGLSRGLSGSYGGNLTFTPTRTAVPEPATWAMMLLGFAGIGWQLRRRGNTALAQLA